MRKRRINLWSRKVGPFSLSVDTDFRCWHIGVGHHYFDHYFGINRFQREYNYVRAFRGKVEANAAAARRTLSQYPFDF